MDQTEMSSLFLSESTSHPIYAYVIDLPIMSRSGELEKPPSDMTHFLFFQPRHFFCCCISCGSTMTFAALTSAAVAEFAAKPFIRAALKNPAEPASVLAFFLVRHF